MEYKVLRTLDNQIVDVCNSLLEARLSATFYTVKTPFWHIVTDENLDKIADPFSEKALEKIASEDNGED